MARPLNQSQMLAEAIPAALGGQFVIVTSFNQNHACELARSAKNALAENMIRFNGQSQMKFNSGGVLNFISKDKDSIEMMRGHRGLLFLLLDSGSDPHLEDLWEVCTEYTLTGCIIPKPFLPPTRFERILMDTDDDQ